MNGVQVDIELILENLLDDELSCEYEHSSRPGSICSVNVTYRITATCQAASFVICTNAAHEKREQMERGTTTCRRCSRLARDCWTLVPI